MFAMLLYIAISFIAVKHFRRPVLLYTRREEKDVKNIVIKL